MSHVRSAIPGVALSTDMIVGFCGETEEEFEETLSLMREVRFHRQFIFQYRYAYYPKGNREKLSSSQSEQSRVRSSIQLSFNSSPFTVSL